MLKKGLKYLLVFGLPFVIDQFVVSYPQVAQLSVGTLLVMGLNFLKVRANLGKAK